MAHFLVIAGSSDIGRATKDLLTAQGHDVTSTARQPQSDDIALDATDFAAVEQVFAKATEAHGPIDGVVNCAGSLWLKPAHMTSADQYRAVIDASLTTAFAVVRAAAKQMTAGGSVVLISSAAAHEGLANHEAIAAAKAGVEGLMRSAAATYAGQNLRFNAVAPGLVQTRMTKALTANDLSRKVSESMHALGRLGTPDDIARAIVFLLDPANDWITGQVLGVDGGLGGIRPRTKI
jgi:NAD(P)-dependent dehydrogenase (short-subunit alcohol dehydrogenase family)